MHHCAALDPQQGSVPVTMETLQLLLGQSKSGAEELLEYKDIENPQVLLNGVSSPPLPPSLLGLIVSPHCQYTYNSVMAGCVCM